MADNAESCMKIAKAPASSNCDYYLWLQLFRALNLAQCEKCGNEMKKSTVKIWPNATMMCGFFIIILLQFMERFVTMIMACKVNLIIFWKPKLFENFKFSNRTTVFLRILSACLLISASETKIFNFFSLATSKNRPLSALRSICVGRL